MTSTAVAQNVSTNATQSQASNVTVTIEISKLHYDVVAAYLIQREVALYGAIHAKKIEAAKINVFIAKAFQGKAEQIAKSLASAAVLDENRAAVESKLLDIQRAQRENSRSK